MILNEWLEPYLSFEKFKYVLKWIDKQCLVLDNSTSKNEMLKNTQFNAKANHLETRFSMV